MSNAKPDDKTQSDKFKEAAKRLECDESEESFNKKLKKLAKQHDKADKKDN